MDIQFNLPKSATQKNDANRTNANTAGAHFQALFKRKLNTLDQDSVQETEREEEISRTDQHIKVQKPTQKPQDTEESIDQTLAKIKDRVMAMLIMHKKP